MSKNLFYPLRIKDIEKATDDCSLISFAIEEELREAFAFNQGQYLTLKASIDGEDVRRSYSLCSSPLDNEWRVGIKKIQGGKFSTYANEQLKPGDTIQVMPPNGRFFTPIEKQKAKNYVAFAAGSGITPIFSIIKTHLQAEPNSTFTLFYINQQVSSIILKEEIDALKNTFLDRFKIFHFLTQEQRSSPLFNGRLDTQKLAIIFDRILPLEQVDDWFICGPQDMIFMLRDYLLEHEVAKKSIHFELFNTDSNTTNVQRQAKETNSVAHCALTVIEGGKAFQVEMSKGTTILDAALQKGADLPFACKGGVCCTCRAKIKEGKVDMLVNYALEPEEVEAGFVLTCQAIPLSEKVVVDFDV